MRNILPAIERWLDEGKSVAVATVIATWGSAPRPLGARMAVCEDGDFAGSVSSGCVEGLVVDEARGVLRSGEPKAILTAVADETAWSVGLTCGGRLEVFIAPLRDDAVFRALKRAVEDDQPAALAVIVAGPGLGRRLLIPRQGTPIGDLGCGELNERIRSRASQLLGTGALISPQGALTTRGDAPTLAQGHCERVVGELGGEPVEVFIGPQLPRRKLIIVGAGHLAIHLITFARPLGFRTFVVDPRTAFASAERFPDADHLITAWPQEALPAIGLDESTYVAVVSHDPKLDLPALRAALAGRVRYVGALGSRRTHARRLATLAEEGFSEAQLDRIHNPIGLPLGGRQAAEIALAIAAELVAVANASGPPERGRR